METKSISEKKKELKIPECRGVVQYLDSFGRQPFQLWPLLCKVFFYYLFLKKCQHFFELQ